MSDDHSHKCTNYVFLYAKYYIYCNKQFEKNDIELWKFHIFLVNKIKYELKSYTTSKNNGIERNWEEKG